MSFTAIVPQIVSVLEGVSKISEVHNYEKYHFDSFPAVCITPSDNESDYETTSENMRSYGFQISIYASREGDDKDKMANLTDGILRELVDDVVDEFDKPANRTLGGTVIWVEPTPSVWGYDTARNLRVATVNLVCKKSIDLTII